MFTPELIAWLKSLFTFVTPDFINGCFELAGAMFILNHCRVLYNDKKVAGVSVVSVMFFVAWGFFNLFYYPSLNQFWSFWAAVIMVGCNLIWVVLLIYYRYVQDSK